MLKKSWIPLLLAFAVLLAILGSPMASDSPDGLERTAKDSGFIARAKEGKGPFREYSFPGISQAKASTALSGLTGTLLAFMTVFLLATLLKRKTPSPKSGDPTRPSEGKSS